jgi:hypothetical protein
MTDPLFIATVALLGLACVGFLIGILIEFVQGVKAFSRS